MATRRMKNTTVLAKIGVTYGTDVVPTGAANALYVSDVSFSPLEATNVDRNLLRAYMGASENLVGTAFKSLGYSVELVGSGTAGIAPAWGPLLRACGFSETLTASTRVDYTPISASFEWIDQYVFWDGALHKLIGCRGGWSIDCNSGAIPKLKLNFNGIDGGIAATAPSGVDYTGWQTPQVVTDANTDDLLLGCSHSTSGAPAFTSGTAYPYSKLAFDLGGDAPFIPLVGGESVEIMDRKLTGDLEIDLTAAQDVSMLAIVKANTLQSLGWKHGTAANKKVLIYTPGMQLTTPTYSDLSGKLMNAYKMVLPPSGTGNNELRIVTSF